MVNKLDKAVLDTLPCLHALNAWDYRAAFLNKDNLRPFNTMLSNKGFVDAIAALETEEAEQSTLAKLEEYVCKLYGYKNQKSVNSSRFESFLRH